MLVVFALTMTNWKYTHTQYSMSVKTNVDGTLAMQQPPISVRLTSGFVFRERLCSLMERPEEERKF